jgi:hypothetical protein
MNLPTQFVDQSTHNPSVSFDPNNLTINPTAIGPRIVFNSIAQIVTINAFDDKIFVEKPIFAIRKPISPRDTMLKPTIRAG